MKHLTLILTLLFSTLMFASPAYADWESIGVSVDGNTIYVDFDRIRKNGSYVYWWELTDYPKPNKYGYLSISAYQQGDCEVFRHKVLSFLFDKQPMGEGSGVTHSPPDPEWIYPTPNSVNEYTLKQVCEYTENL
ncbi:hypothetical protein OAN06_02945 [Hellea sp.]|nr:hypothetical protein [Hellea sp.]